jgi:hypothetical protein
MYIVYVMDAAVPHLTVARIRTLLGLAAAHPHFPAGRFRTSLILRFLVGSLGLLNLVSWGLTFAGHCFPGFL